MSIRLSLDLIQCFLCGAVTGETAQRTEAARSLRQYLGDDALMALAERNDVTSLVAHALMQTNDTKLPAYWKGVHTSTQDRISAYLSELDRIADQLAEDGIQLVALKNGGIARGIYPCTGCCPMGDIDVLVEKRHFRKAHKILLENGYHFDFRSRLEKRHFRKAHEILLENGYHFDFCSPLEEAELVASEEDGGAEYWKNLPRGVKLCFELQWRPVAGRWIRQDQEPSAEELMARSIAIPSSAVRLLSPEDNLLQVVLHTAKHTYVRAPGFRLHLDVVRIVEAYPDLDWQVFVKRLLSHQIKLPAYFSLAIPKALFNTPIPDWVLDRLRPPRWKEFIITKWLQKVCLFNPHEKKFSKPGYILFNALMYDDAKGLFSSMFPSKAFMRDRYGAKNNISLLRAHVKRLLDLSFRRVNT